MVRQLRWCEPWLLLITDNQFILLRLRQCDLEAERRGLIAHPSSAWLTPEMQVVVDSGGVREGLWRRGGCFWCRTLISSAWAVLAASAAAVLQYRALWRDPRVWILEGLCQREKNMTFKIVSACLLVHTQLRKGFSGPSETQEREREKKNKRKKIQEKKNVIQSVFFSFLFFWRERFTDTRGRTTLML